MEEDDQKEQWQKGSVLSIKQRILTDLLSEEILVFLVHPSLLSYFRP